MPGMIGRTYVTRPTLEDPKPIYSLRIIPERLALDYACRNATSADLAQRQILQSQACLIGLTALAAREHPQRANLAAPTFDGRNQKGRRQVSNNHA